MNALLVDDDYFVVTALEKKIDWKALHIETVYTANNVAQAWDILEKHPIQILISDIEMPQGSGLELLSRIREEKYNVQTIFLTNYADFNYAQKAIELQSFEYFLKPIEFDKLMLIIQKAAVRAKEQQKNEKAILEGRYWQKNRSKIIEHFWHKLITSSASNPVKPAAISHSVEEQNLSYQKRDVFQLLLFNLFPYDGSMGAEEKNLFDFAFQNVICELFQSDRFTVETIVEYKDNSLAAVIRWNSSPDPELIEQLARSFIQQANPILKCDACCMISLADSLEQLGLTIKQLLDMNEEMTMQRNQIFYVEEYQRQKDEDYIPPDLSRLEELLNLNKPAVFLEETSRYLRSRPNQKALSRSVLRLFRLDMVQLVYSFLKLKDIQAHKLYTGKINDQLSICSLYSIEDMERYLRYLVYTAVEYRDFAAQPKSVVEEIKQYIHAHYGDDLTRNGLAEVVYLNQDYLGRLFKKETGIPLGSYIIQVRIEAAKQLLETTNLSVYTISGKVGYSNYSYFSKLFKQEVGVTPNDYKKHVKAK
ncbi:response regulator transcription factor [Paenibacillus protaetiae]|uniref:Response regulator n=1 Tax=Paenibacillus protaetiae TaxID=2509456 RepID=A0A4P6EXY4_9BACL|nr:response regulator [Paenibacillus protaetiae]QAY67934.1 response regulator [Paenibacillus protaetiae]